MKFFSSSKVRMIQWLLISLAAYAIAAALASVTIYGELGLFPRIQTVLWKIGHLTIAAYLGFVLDRHCFRDVLNSYSDPRLHIRRALIVAATMIAFGLAL